MKNPTLTPIAHARLRDDQPLGKPPSMTDDQCGTLYVRVEQDPLFPGLPSIYSRWIPSPEQRQRLAEVNYDIYLNVIGGHPPVMLYVGQELHDTPITLETLERETAAQAPHGWVFNGPDAEWYWSAQPDRHPDTTELRPATALERSQFQQIKKMRDAMQTFVDRVDAGEVRSTRTYSQFKELLTGHRE
jgi:hypothetical protein